MGIVFAIAFLLGVVVLLSSLRIRGCASFLLWMLLGMSVVWFVLQFASGGLRM